TRKQAIEDGVLVDLSNNEVAKSHWKFPLACTDSVWAIFQEAMEQEAHDANGILHDVSVVAKLSLQGKPDRNQTIFTTRIGERNHRLKLHIGPGDDALPVLTLMLPHED